MKTLTIKIEKLKDGKQIGYCATIKELNNSMIMADKISEIFDLIPDVIETCVEGDIGIFSSKGAN